MHSNNIVILRVEASHSVGFGHMMRCFALARSLSKKVSVVFFSDSEYVFDECVKRNLIFIKCKDDMRGLQQVWTTLPSRKITSILIDTKKPYSLSDVLLLKDLCRKVYFVENVSPGTLGADRIIFPAGHFDYQNVYGDLDFVMPLEKLIFGEKYVLIRDELIACEAKNGGGLVVTTGASDPCGVMLILDELLAKLQIKAHFLIGEKFKFTLPELGKKYGSTYSHYCSTFIAEADIIISAFGVSIYEGLFLKKNIISIAHSLENARGSRIIAQKTPMVKNLGFYKTLDSSALKHAINDLKEVCFDNKMMKIDGFGAERVSEMILRDD